VPEPATSRAATALAADVVARLAASGRTVATGESLTAGLIAATLAEVPGCSAVLTGGVVAYTPAVKAAVLGVPAAALAEGLVSQAVAAALATGAARVAGADIGVGATGVAGPEPHDGQPVGSVWISVASGDRVLSRHLALAGGRQEIRCQTVVAALGLLADALADDSGPGMAGNSPD
jgi:nicotinamide-nucleotide amidase